MLFHKIKFTPKHLASRFLVMFCLLIAIFGGLSMQTPASAQTFNYTQVFTDNFHRTNTVVGTGVNSTNVTGPNGTTGQTFSSPATGSNYIDVTPGTHWLIGNNQANNSSQPTYDPLVRPTSDNLLNARITSVASGGYSAPLIRWTGTNGYWPIVASSSAIYIYRGVPGSGTLINTIAGTGFSSNNVSIQAVNNAANTSVTLYVYTSGVLAGQYTDTAAPLVNAGSWGVLGYGTYLTSLTAETVNLVTGITAGTAGATSNGLGSPGNDAPVYNPATGKLSVVLTSTLPLGGNGTYTYQWGKSTTSGAETAVSGATTQTVTLTGLTPGTLYYVNCAENDTANTGSVNTAELPILIPVAPLYNVVCSGNSLTGGVSATSTFSGSTVLGTGNLFGTGFDYPSQLANILGPAFNVLNTGMSGSTTEGLNSAQVDGLYSSTYTANYCVVWEITNSLNNGDSAAAAQAAIISYCQARKAKGYKVILVGCMPRGGSSDATFEADRTSINTYLRSHWKSGGIADAYVDLQNADARIGFVNAYTTSPAYWSGSLHLDNAGYGVVADLVADAIDNLVAGGNTASSATTKIIRRIN